MAKKTNFTKKLDEFTEEIKEVVITNYDKLLNEHSRLVSVHNTEVLEENKILKEEKRVLQQQLNALSRFSSQTIERLDAQEEHKKDMLIHRTRENHLEVMTKMRKELRLYKARYKALIKHNGEHKKNGIMRTMAKLLSTGCALYWRMDVDEIIDKVAGKKYETKMRKLTKKMEAEDEKI